jgi:hypothetical protein
MFTQKYYADDALFQTSKAAVPHKTILLQLLAVYVGSILTFQLQLLHQTAIASSPITTCLAWLFLLLVDKNNRALILAVYCGSFAGMSAYCLGADCTDSMASMYGHAAIFSLAAALCYVTIQFLSSHFPKAMLTGYGGRLGTTAFLSSYLCSLVLTERTNFIDLRQIMTSTEPPENYIYYSIIACGGAILPFLILRKKWDNVDTYFLTGLTAFLALIGSFLFSIFFPELDLAPAAFYAGLFVSMTKSDLCAPRGLALAGALSGMLMLNVLCVFKGIGGNLGLTAMLSVLTVTAFFYAVAPLSRFLWRMPLVSFMIAAIVGYSWVASYFLSPVPQSSSSWKTQIMTVEGANP